LKDAGIKLGTVASDVLGVSGRAMLDALVLRTHDPALLGELLAHLDYLEEAVERLSSEVARVVAPFSPLLGLLITIPGVSQRTAEVILAEVGTDMGQFPSAGHLASWARMCPRDNESAGKHRAGTTRKGSRWLRVALIEAAKPPTPPHAARHRLCQPVRQTKGTGDTSRRSWRSRTRSW
jgi:transposase